MTYESVTLADGRQITVEVKDGYKLTPDDIPYLEEYVRIMDMMPQPDVEGFQIGDPSRVRR